MVLSNAVKQLRPVIGLDAGVIVVKSRVACPGDFNFLGGAGPDNDNAKSNSGLAH